LISVVLLNSTTTTILSSCWINSIPQTVIAAPAPSNIQRYNQSISGSVSVSSSALPTGAALDSSLTTINSTLNSGVALVNGTTMNVSGITGPVDTSTTFNFTASAQNVTLNTNGASTALVQMTSSANSICQVYGSIDGVTWLGPLWVIPTYAGFQYWNGDRGTIISDPTMIYKFDCSAYASIKVQCYSYSSSCTGTLRVNGASTTVDNSQPFFIEGIRQTSSYSTVVSINSGSITFPYYLLSVYVTNGHMRLHEIDMKGYSTGASPALITYKLSRYYNSGSAPISGGTATSISGVSHLNTDGFAFPTTSQGGTALSLWTSQPTPAGTESVFRNSQVFCPSLSSPTYSDGDTLNYDSNTVKAMDINNGYMLLITLTGMTSTSIVDLMVNLKFALINGL